MSLTYRALCLFLPIGGLFHCFATRKVKYSSTFKILLGIMVTAAVFTDLLVHERALWCVCSGAGGGRERNLKGGNMYRDGKEKTFGKFCLETSMLNISCYHLAGSFIGVLLMSADE